MKNEIRKGRGDRLPPLVPPSVDEVRRPKRGDKLPTLSTSSSTEVAPFL